MDDKKEEEKKDDLQEGPLINREEELEKLNSFLEDLKDNESGHLVLIAGEPGVGKTRLIHEVKKKAEEKNFEVLKGNCSYEMSHPYLPFQQAWKESMGSLLPSITAFLHTIPEVEELEDEMMFKTHRRAAFFESAKELKEAVRDVPHIVLIEDLHWADKSTLNLFHYLAERLKDEPVLFIGTYRPGDVVPGDAFSEMKYKLSSEEFYNEMKLEPLTFQEMVEFVENIVGVKDISEEFLKKLYEKTNGNPLFVKEGIHHLHEVDAISPYKGEFPVSKEDFVIPEEIENLVERRVFRLGAKSREILQIGSVIGESVPFSLLSKAIDLDELDILDYIDKIRETKLWIEEKDGERFRFSHDKIKSTIYEGIGKWVEKQRYHRRVAEAIEELYKKSLQNKYDVLAEHYMKGEEYSKAVSYYLKAAERAKRVYAHEDTIGMYQKALELVEQTPESPIDKSKILEDIAVTYRLIGEYEKSKNELYKALNFASDLKEEQNIYLQIIKALKEEGKYEEALEVIKKREQLEDEDTLERGNFLGNKGWILRKLRRFDEALQAFEEEKKVAEGLQNNELIGSAYHHLGSLANLRGDLEEAKKYLEKARNIREEMEDLKNLPNTLNDLAALHAKRGDLDKALKVFKNCLEIYEKTGNKTDRPKIHNNIGITYQKEGNLEEALYHFERAYELSDQTEKRFLKARISVNLGRLYREKGHFEKAEKYLMEGRDLAEETNHLHQKIHSEYLLGKIEIRKGNIEKGKNYLIELVESTSEREDERDKGLIRSLKGLIQREEGKMKESIESFKSAIQIFDETNSYDQKAITMYDLGSLLMDKDDNEAGTEYLQKALDYFQERNMELWIQRCKEVMPSN